MTTTIDSSSNSNDKKNGHTHNRQIRATRKAKTNIYDQEQ